jgi:hypothetical protein
MQLLLVKNHRLSYPCNERRSFSIVHYDIWGSSPVKSNSVFTYSVLVTDNYSRFSWLYPLKFKYDFGSVPGPSSPNSVSGPLSSLALSGPVVAQTVPPISITSNRISSHPMLTRAKAGIFKSRHPANLGVFSSTGLLSTFLASAKLKGFKSTAKNLAWLASMNEEIRDL